mgnify:CR=1 FL=1
MTRIIIKDIIIAMNNQPHTPSHSINQTPAQRLKSIFDEQLSFFKAKSEIVPIFVQAIGITNPTADYSIFRPRGDIHVLEYVVSGKGYICADQKTYTVTSGDVYFLKNNTAHQYFADKSDPFKKIWINFTGEVFDILAEKLKIDSVYIAHLPECKQEFEKLYSISEFSENNEDICYEASRIVFNIFLQFFLLENSKQKKNSFAEQIRNELDAAVYSSSNITDIAKKLFISRQHLSREFKKHYNEAPYQYLINQKLQAAKNLLRYTDLPIKAIASCLGFNDENHFSTLFKNKIKMTPLSYKKNFSNSPQ